MFTSGSSQTSQTSQKFYGISEEKDCFFPTQETFLRKKNAKESRRDMKLSSYPSSLEVFISDPTISNRSIVKMGGEKVTIGQLFVNVESITEWLKHLH